MDPTTTSVNSSSIVKLGLFLLAIIYLPLAFLGSFMMYFGTIETKPQEQTQGTTTDVAKKEIPKDLLPIYQGAGQKYHVPWNILASIHWRETSFGRTTLPGDPRRKAMTSSANAQGPMQFTPQNGDGMIDVWNEVNAIYSTANMFRKTLDRNGGDMRKAILRYNDAGWYADQVLAKANEYVKATPVLVSSNNQQVSASGLILAWPTTFTHNVTSPFGSRFHPIRHLFVLHDGIDISVEGIYGKPALAAAPGKVIRVGFDPVGYGNFVRNGLETLYGHLAQSSVSLGQVVQVGQQVGFIGNTGGSTGPHLHFMVHYQGQPRNPMDFLK